MRKTKKLNKAKSRGELFIMKKKFLAIVTAALIGTTAFASVANAASGTIDVIPVKMVQEHEEHSSSCLGLKKNRVMKK